MFRGCIIYSVAFSRDNQRAFISDYRGGIGVIKWKVGANSGDDFHWSEGFEKLGFEGTHSICLTKDEKYLLVGSKKEFFVYETTTREVIKEFQLTDSVIAINLIKNNKKAIIVEQNGHVSILDLETMQISLIAKNIWNDLNQIAVL